ncbi:hypothetical protein ACJX0J_007309, partial [Zea mays]
IDRDMNMMSIRTRMYMQSFFFPGFLYSSELSIIIKADYASEEPTPLGNHHQRWKFRVPVISLHTARACVFYEKPRTRTNKIKRKAMSGEHYPIYTFPDPSSEFTFIL